MSTSTETSRALSPRGRTGSAIGVAVCGATVLLGLVSTGRWARAHAESSSRQLNTRVTVDARPRDTEVGR